MQLNCSPGSGALLPSLLLPPLSSISVLPDTSPPSPVASDGIENALLALFVLSTRTLHSSRGFFY